MNCIWALGRPDRLGFCFQITSSSQIQVRARVRADIESGIGTDFPTRSSSNLAIMIPLEPHWQAAQLKVRVVPAMIRVAVDCRDVDWRDCPGLRLAGSESAGPGIQVRVCLELGVLVRLGVSGS